METEYNRSSIDENPRNNLGENNEVLDHPNLGENNEVLDHSNEKCAVFWDFENCV